MTFQYCRCKLKSLKPLVTLELSSTSSCHYRHMLLHFVELDSFTSDNYVQLFDHDNHRRQKSSPAVRSVTLNLANKFSQCTFSVSEHYDLFSDLIILRQASWRRSYDVIAYAPTAPNRQRNCCRKSSTLPHRPEINLYAFYHALHDETTHLESTATSKPSGTTDAIFTKLPRPLAKDHKSTLAN